MKLICIVNGCKSGEAFPVDIAAASTIGDLKTAIKRKENIFKDVDAKDLALWKVSIPVIAVNKNDTVTLASLPDGSMEELHPVDVLSDLFDDKLPKRSIHVLVRGPSPGSLEPILKRKLEEDPDLALVTKKSRIQEQWREYMASDNMPVMLPPGWIAMLESDEFAPEPRTAFSHLKNNLHAGVAIDMPYLGQTPKEYSSGQPFFVTEQMIEIWNEIQNGDEEDKHRVYRRVLSGPMGVGKTYLTYFLAASAYAEKMLTLYIADAGVLKTSEEDHSALEIVKRFLALNKDILTAIELKMLCPYDGAYVNALQVIFRTLLMQKERKTLLIVDEHGNLFEEKPYMPVRFMSLNPLSDFHFWLEDYRGAHVIFTGTADAKYEMKVLDASYLPKLQVFVGPLSDEVFSKMLTSHPRWNTPAIMDRVKELTNCVPRELKQMSRYFKGGQDSMTCLQNYTQARTNYFLGITKAYVKSLEEKKEFYEALEQMFLNGTSTIDLPWDISDLGLIYQVKDRRDNTVKRHTLCHSARKALWELYTRSTITIPRFLTEGTMEL
ncbi:hypothetical protein BGZ65_001377 [Modicella reniformis]|uniref:Crinkler effector protein N-terminal domain-containing protein n=1 Tax=Modicella reniformis TaxID=1440133 RepID=A0A9P6J2B9_9FUNG|nr:hypothetical protein BGZ65_001377 [Modicella reniformis]